MDELKPVFASLSRRLKKDHAALREDLVRRLPEKVPGEPLGPGSSAFLQGYLKIAALLVLALGLTATFLVFMRTEPLLAWAANDQFEAQAAIEEQRDGTIVTRFSVWDCRENKGPKKLKPTWTPTLVVRDGNSAIISVVEDDGRQLEIQQVIAKGAKQALAIVVIKDLKGVVEWATALTVPVSRTKRE